MSLFKKVLAFCLSFEGELANHPHDRGGLTWKGIARNAHPDWEGWAYIDKGQPPPDALVEKLYYERFWLPLKCDLLPPPIALFLFDTAVGTGNFEAVRMLQRSLRNVRVDGIMGPQTIKAANNANLYTVLDFFRIYRRRHYHRIVKNDPTQEKFLEGWENRSEAAFGVAVCMLPRNQTLAARFGLVADDGRVTGV